MTKIYTLTDPRTPEDIRYVGKTVQPLSKRLAKHLTDFKFKSHRANWIKSLLIAGIKPEIKEFAVVVDDSKAAKIEIQWIKFFRENGHNLVNSTDGGEGCLGRKFSQTAITKMSLAAKGNKRRLGMKNSVWHNEQISLANKGRKFSAEHITNLSKAQQARYLKERTI